MILITTAGKVGSEAARLLAEREVPVRILVRDPEKATALAQAGVEVAEGDLEVPASIEVAMRGVSAVMLVSPGVEPVQEPNVVGAAAAAAGLLQDEEGNRTYELGGPAFDLPELARVISEVTGVPVTYRDLPVDGYVSRLRRAGLDEATAQFVSALDASIAHGDLETDSEDLSRLLGRPVTPLTDVVRAARA